MKPILFFLPLFCAGACTPGASNGEAEELTLLVGTYTDGSSRGIYTFNFDPQTGKSNPLDSVALSNPSYLTVSPDRKHVYAVSEMKDSTAALYTLAFEPAKGSLRVLDKQLTLGAEPCYVSTGQGHVLTANYSGGNMTVFPLRTDGTAAPAEALFQGQATGPDSIRQCEPHIHCALFSPDSNYVFATDFSADRLLRFTVNKEGIGTRPEDTLSIPVDPDTGPRHLTFAPDGRHAYVIGELSGRITVFAYADGQLNTLQTVAADTTGARGSADIHISPDGRFLYASNRLKEDGIAILAIHPQEGTLTKVGYQRTGLHPRHFNLTPDGKLLLVACRDSNLIQVFRRDSESGMLTDTHQDIRLDKPVCIVFVNKH